jgi:hypothetical protein
MQKANIPRASFAFAKMNLEGKVSITPQDLSAKDASPAKTEVTSLPCASLSKPVFAYLVLKLIEVNKTNPAESYLGKFKTEFDLDTPLYKLYHDKDGKVISNDENPFLKKFDTKYQENAKKLTARMVLSHTTGLHIVDKEPYKFQFKPGKHYAYSGPGIACLQGAIDELTGSNLEILAKAHVFGEHMPLSTYGSKPEAARSLETTAEEYARFITAWINDDKLNYAFESAFPANSMKNDYFPHSNDRLVKNIDVADADSQRVAWGLGIGLVKNNQGQIIGAYHTGDMDEVRAGFGATIDPKSKQCTGASVYLTNSHNGHILAEQVLPAPLKPALNYFFPTYGFARNVSQLDNTDFHGLNPKILKPKLKKLAY